MTTTLKADYTPRAIERRCHDRRKAAKSIALRMVIINAVMLGLGAAFGYWYAMQEMSQTVLEALK